jgi:hypothetical protein
MDNSLGTWKLNVEKSKHTPALLPFKSQSVIRSASDGGVKVKTTGVQADGTALSSSYTAKYDGKDSPVTGAPFDTIAIKQEDANTFTATVKQASGKFHAKGRTVISKDGKVMTTTVSGTNADGKAFSATLVYDKQ